VVLGAGAAGLLVFALGISFALGVEPATLVSAALAGAVTAYLVVRHRGPILRGAERARIAIVPWGVLVHSEPNPRVLRWAAVRSVTVDFVHEMDHATPSTRWSIVTIRTERELFGGRVAGSVSLERLEAHFETYAAEAARPLALDLDGTVTVDEWLEPTFELLLAEARRLLRSGELGARWSLPPASYREPSAPRASEQTIGELSSLLETEPCSAADPRPLAAVLAAELGANELCDVVSRLSTSPHPMVAAVARAAALRLGAAVKRVGAVDEVAEFVPSRDLEQMRSWVQAA
jgi:hypothetical protein